MEIRKLVSKMSEKKYDLHDDDLIGSITIKTTRQINTFLDWGTIVVSPKAVWLEKSIK